MLTSSHFNIMYKSSLPKFRCILLNHYCQIICSKKPNNIFEKHNIFCCVNYCNTIISFLRILHTQCKEEKLDIIVNKKKKIMLVVFFFCFLMQFLFVMCHNMSLNVHYIGAIYLKYICTCTCKLRLSLER